MRRQFIGQFYRASLHGRNSEIGEVMSPDISRSPNGTLFASDDSDRIPRCTQGRRPERAQDSSSGQAKGRWPRSAARGKARQQLKSPGQGRQDWSLKCLAISILTGWTFDNWNTFCRPSRATYPRIRDRGRRRRAACPRLPTNSSHNSLFCKLLVKQVTSPFLGWWPLSTVSRPSGQVPNRRLALLPAGSSAEPRPDILPSEKRAGGSKENSSGQAKGRWPRSAARSLWQEGEQPWRGAR